MGNLMARNTEMGWTWKKAVDRRRSLPGSLRDKASCWLPQPGCQKIHKILRKISATKAEITGRGNLSYSDHWFNADMDLMLSSSL
jgi:hypothetical protein